MTGDNGSHPAGLTLNLTPHAAQLLQDAAQNAQADGIPYITVRHILQALTALSKQAGDQALD